MLFSVALGGVFASLFRMSRVGMSRMGMMSGFLMIACFMVLSGFVMVLGSLFVVTSRLLVMRGAFL